MESAYLPLVFALLALAASGALGSVLISTSLHALRQTLPLGLIIGAGLPMGLAIGSWLLRSINHLLPSLQQAAWLAVGLLLACVVIAVLAARKRRRGRPITPNVMVSTSAQATSSKRWFYALTGLLAGTHIAISAFNNLTRDIFPWDAFTTWMYRAKAWVLDNHLTPIINAQTWIAEGGTNGIPVYASHYPTLLSDIAAWMSALCGNWHAAAASLPWTAAGLDLVASVWGLLHAAGTSWFIALFGAVIAVSLPLLDMHVALAGYGDLWMALTAGVGLGLLLLWAQINEGATLQRQLSQSTLWLGIALLLISTQFKLEGWLWLAMGLVFIGASLLKARQLMVATVVLILFIAAHIMATGTTAINLGPFGLWGLADQQIHVGFLGHYALRLYNPVGDYIDALLLQKNLSLLLFFYVAALAWLLLKQPKVARHHLFMGALIIASQGVIFGVSSFSQYAESGTAITRLVLHFVPVFIFTALVAANHSPAKLASSAQRQNHAEKQGLSKTPAVIYPTTTLRMSLLLLGSLAVSVLVVTASTGGLSATAVRVLPSDMQPIVGTGALTEEELWQFNQSPQSVGVIRHLQPPADGTRFVSLVAEGESAREVIFYWFDRRNPETMHRRNLTRVGSNLFDMETDTSWSPAHIGEWGVVVPAPYFDAASVGPVVFSSGLGWAQVPGMVNQWLQPVDVTQRTLNNLSSLVAGGPTGQSVALLAATLLLLTAVFGPGSLRCTSFMAIGCLWFVSDLLWLQGHARASLLTTQSNLPSSVARNEGRHLTKMAASLEATLPQDKPLLVIPADNGYDYESQRLPFLLLPAKSTFVDANNNRILKDWEGVVLVYGERLEQLNAKTTAVLKQLGRAEIQVMYGNNFNLIR